jgi:hypothetical protein
MSEHTPGPWIAKHRHSEAKATDDEIYGLGWYIEGPPEPMRGQFAKAADARLIAAAPQMLAALEAALPGIRRASQPNVEDMIVAAIAKARGITQKY